MILWVYLTRNKKSGQGVSNTTTLLTVLLVISVGGNVLIWHLSYSQGSAAGYGEGLAEGYVQGVRAGAGTGYSIRDPAFEEAMDFIERDRTETLEYSDDFVCSRFAATFKQNAFDAGFRCFYVNIKFSGLAGHAIVAFNTTDKGLIFIEPQHDLLVSLEIGKSYCELNNLEGSSNDRIIDYILIP